MADFSVINLIEYFNMIKVLKTIIIGILLIGLSGCCNMVIEAPIPLEPQITKTEAVKIAKDFLLNTKGMKSFDPHSGKVLEDSENFTCWTVIFKRTEEIRPSAYMVSIHKMTGSPELVPLR